MMEDNKKLSFIWDYDVSPEMAHQILKGPDCHEKDWLMARILQDAPWELIWEYLDLSAINNRLDYLPLKPILKSHWKYALKQWR